MSLNTFWSSLFEVFLLQPLNWLKKNWWLGLQVLTFVSGFFVSWIEIRCVWLKQRQLNFLLYRQFGELFYVSWSVDKINPLFKDQQIENFDHWRILIVWFNDIKWTKFLFFIDFIATQKDHIWRKLNSKKKNLYV